MKQSLRRVVRGIAPVALAGLVLSLTGCHNFFLCDKASCTDSGGGGNTPAGNVAYVSNNTKGSTFFSGYTLAGTTLTATTGSPYSNNTTPTAMVVSRNNAFLYEASTANGSVAGVYGFSIGTGGALTSLSGGAALITSSATPIVAMDVSADGNWLVVTTLYDSLNGQGSTIAAYQISPSSGLVISTPQPTTYGGSGSSPAVSAVKVAPSGQYIAVALQTGGLVVFPFANGALGSGALINPPSGGAFDLAIDNNNLLYVAVTGGVNVYTYTPAVTAGGVPTLNVVESQKTNSAAPFALALDGTSFLYASASNGTTNSIYGFSIASGGKLTPFTTNNPVSSPANTTKLTVDSTGAYLLALGYDTSAGLQMYSITSATGALASLATAPTGGTSTAVSAALALTH